MQLLLHVETIIIQHTSASLSEVTIELFIKFFTILLRSTNLAINLGRIPCGKLESGISGVMFFSFDYNISKSLYPP